MNARLSLAAIADRLKASPLMTDVYISTSYQRDYLTAFGTTYPAVWVCGQRLTKASNSGNASGLYRQIVNVEIAVRLVVQRYADGITDAETALNMLADNVASVLKDWTPPGAEFALGWESAQDGPANESVVTADLIFSTKVIYTRYPT